MLAAQAKAGPLVLCVVEADASVREALCRLASAGGFRPRAFATIEQLVSELEPGGRGCVLLDSSLVRNATSLGKMLRSRCFDWPLIVLCASADEAARHEARDLGASLLLNKPVDAQALFDSIAWVTDQAT